TAAGAAPFAPNAWLRIGAGGIVALTIDRSEMGQGSQTGLALILAEELEADWSTIRLGPMPENPAGWPRMMRTGGSNAIRSSWEPLRKAGATAREMLVTAAAETWKVDRATCRAGQGVVIHVPSGRRLPYGRLAARAASLPVPTDVPLKDPKDFRLVGTRVKRLDTPGDVPLLHHATLEPMNCTAHVRAGECDVWAPTQNQGDAQRVAAEVSGLPKEKVRIHTTPSGGGFGRRLEPDFVSEAV